MKKRSSRGSSKRRTRWGRYQLTRPRAGKVRELNVPAGSVVYSLYAVVRLPKHAGDKGLLHEFLVANARKAALWRHHRSKGGARYREAVARYKSARHEYLKSKGGELVHRRVEFIIPAEHAHEILRELMRRMRHQAPEKDFETVTLESIGDVQRYLKERTFHADVEDYGVALRYPCPLGCTAAFKNPRELVNHLMHGHGLSERAAWETFRANYEEADEDG